MASTSRRLALKIYLPDEEAASTAFNALSFNETTISMTKALHLVAAASSAITKTLTEIGRNMQRFSRGINKPRPNRGIMRSRGNSNNNNYGGQNRPHHFLTSRTRREEVGLIADNRHNVFKTPSEEELTCFVTAVDNQDTKIMTADFDCYQNVGQTSCSTDTTSKNWRTTISSGYCPSM